MDGSGPFEEDMRIAVIVELRLSYLQNQTVSIRRRRPLPNTYPGASALSDEVIRCNGGGEKVLQAERGLYILDPGDQSSVKLAWLARIARTTMAQEDFFFVRCSQVDVKSIRVLS
jgi:hypothetical protein